MVAGALAVAAGAAGAAEGSHEGAALEAGAQDHSQMVPPAAMPTTIASTLWTLGSVRKTFCGTRTWCVSAVHTSLSTNRACLPRTGPTPPAVLYDACQAKVPLLCSPVH